MAQLLISSLLMSIRKSSVDPQLSRLEKSETTLVMFNQSELKPLGCVKVETTNPRNDQCFLTEYTVVPQGHTAL